MLPTTKGDTTFLVVLCVRNEGSQVLDWIAHHVASGVNRLLVFSNDCQDGTDAILDRLQQMGWLTHLRNPGPYHKKGIQFTALKMAQKHDLCRNADWILPIDIDEFVNVKIGDRRLQSLIGAVPEATAIPLTWRLFGNPGIAQDPGMPITETFTRCAPEVLTWPWRAVMFKTLFRNDGTYRALGVHRPRQPNEDKLKKARWYDGGGRPMPEIYKTERLFSDYRQSNYGLVQLNHYPLGAYDSYILKTDRGRVNRSGTPLGMDYWVERNLTQTEDLSIQALRSATQEIRAFLQADSELQKLHEHAVVWRKTRFMELMRGEAYRALYGRLLMCAPSKIPDADSVAFLQAQGRAALDSEAREP